MKDWSDSPFYKPQITKPKTPDTEARARTTAGELCERITLVNRAMAFCSDCANPPENWDTKGTVEAMVQFAAAEIAALKTSHDQSDAKEAEMLRGDFSKRERRWLETLIRLRNEAAGRVVNANPSASFYGELKSECNALSWACRQLQPYNAGKEAKSE